jgi:SAM-dependent methyltransferase
MTSSAAQSGAGRKKVPASSRDAASREAASGGTVDGKPDGFTAEAGTADAGTAAEGTGGVEAADLATGPEKRAVIARLMLGSAIMLFLELALIRWLGSNVVHLSYFSNFVLLGSFLGIGIGFLISRRSWSILPVAPILLAALVLFVLLFPVQIKDQVGASIIYFTSLDTSGPPAWLVLPIIFIVVAVILAGPAEVVGRCFGRLRPLTSYRYDLVGSLIGITLFTGVSFLRAPSYVWGLLVTAGFVLLIGGWKRILTAVVGVGMIVALLLESLAPGISWSPYYKVKTEDWVFNNVNVVNISVNGIPHQLMAPADWKLTYGEQLYSKPYERTPNNPLDNVLIVGAGSGSDVAIALAKGAKHIDAVDIDPRIVQIGEERNPDHAYQDPRVTVHINDGRAFLETTDTKYDLIMFALPDSLALVNGASQIRLESFLFTEEAIQSAKDHLKPDGAFTMYNYYRDDWLIDRLAGTVQQAFGHVPCVDLLGGAQAVITTAVDPANQSCATAYKPSGEVIAPATDDRPFLYFKGGSIPALYLWVLAGILLISLIAVRAFGGPFRSMRPYADLFFMGAAFLLLETKNVATFALLFGTTWLVNAMVFAGVLVIVLAAVETTRRFRTPPLPLVYIGIALSLALAWVVKPEWILALPFWPRLVVAILLAFLPIYLANVAFSKRFAASGDSQTAFATNLLGAIVGGCLEYAALLTGYRNLLLIVALLYLLAFLLMPKSARVLARS